MRRLESILVKTKTFKMFVMSLKCVLFMSIIIIIIILELRSTERAEPTFHKGFYCFQKTSGYEGSEER